MKKKLFRRPDVADIRALKIHDVRSDNDLVGRILSLQDGEGIRVRHRLLPDNMYSRGGTGWAATKRFAHTGYFPNVDRGYGSSMQERFRSCIQNLHGLIRSQTWVGFCWKPQERPLHKLALDDILLGSMKFEYGIAVRAPTKGDVGKMRGIHVKKYADSFVCKIPREEMHRSRRILNIYSFPTRESDDPLSDALHAHGLYEHPEDAPRSQTFMDLRRVEGNMRPHLIWSDEVAAFYAVALQEGDVSQRFCPVPYPTSRAQKIFSHLRNSLIVCDSTLEGRELRHAHYKEMAAILGKCIAAIGYDEMFMSPHEAFANQDQVRLIDV